MSTYFLKHHFDPDFETRVLTPRERADGSVNQYELGYAQNVVAGQVLAEWVLLDREPGEAERRFLFSEKRFPVGTGCAEDPADPNALVALVNGHVRYENGRISVRQTLTVNRDIDFHTGNVIFVGDLMVGGAVRSGFEVGGRNVTVREIVEAGRLRAMGTVVAEAGIKGGGRAVVRAGKSVRTKFCESAELHAGKNILIDGTSMHCALHAGERLAVKGRLIGGKVVAAGSVFVGEQLGGGPRTQTRLLLGYDPEIIHKERQLRAKVGHDHERIAKLTGLSAISDLYAEEYGLALEEARRKLAAHQAQLRRLWDKRFDVGRFSDCRVIVPGKVGSNVEISIGEAVLDAPEDVRDVVFRYQDGEIVMESPAMGH